MRCIVMVPVYATSIQVHYHITTPPLSAAAASCRSCTPKMPPLLLRLSAVKPARRERLTGDAPGNHASLILLRWDLRIF